MGKIVAAITAVVSLLTKWLSVKDANSWSPDAQRRRLRLEIARLEDEKKNWQNKRSAYLRSGMSIPDKLRDKIKELVDRISALERQLESLEKR